ncbi:MAG: ATP-binding cassette domain-containing protein [Sporolactobacillus sp.]
MTDYVRLQNIVVRYGNFTVLDHVSLQIDAQTTLGLVGESGSGKSTLAKVIAGLIRPEQGDVQVGGAVLRGKRSREQHRGIQMVFQNPDSSFNPRHTIRQMFAEALLFHHIVPRPQVDARCREWLRRVQIDERALDRYPHEFSGGQRQRLAIARALCVEPRLLIADEPTSALDVSVQRHVLDLLRELKEELKLTMLFISHDMAVIHALCDQVAVMRHGSIIEVSPKQQFFTAPREAYSYELLSAVPKMPSFHSDKSGEKE